MEEKTDKIQFPLDFDKCPHCGSTRRIAGEVLESERRKGKIGPDAKAFMFQYNNVIMDVSKTVLSAPVIITFYDVCVDCGAVYCIHTELGTHVQGIGKG